jgi:predicted DNA-binding protein with PD1-like motif
MLFAQVHGSKSFIGCLESGSELVASVMALCEDKGIESAYISGHGFVENPELVQFSRSEKKYLPAVTHDGVFVTAAVQGFVSLSDKDKPGLQLFCQAMATGRGRSKSIAGMLVSAGVLQFEFVIQTVDNIAMKRMNCGDTGLDLWLQMVPAGALRADPGPQASAAPFKERHLVEKRDDDEDLFEEDAHLRTGDWLDHPRLGMCWIISFDGDERVKVKLKSGRIAELLMSLFRLTVAGVKDGGKIYKVEMRKRKER